MSKKIYTHNVATEIVGCFEDILEENDITIPDADRSGDEGEARIYGMTFAALEESIEKILVKTLEQAGVKDFVTGVYE